jgi:hypothetical protein
LGEVERAIAQQGRPFHAALAPAKFQDFPRHGLPRTGNTRRLTERMTEHYSHIAHSEKVHAATKALSLVAATRVGTSVGTAATETKTAGEESL